MAKSTSEIQTTIQSNFMASATLVEAYKLDSSKTFGEQFSNVSVEAVLIYVIAIAFNAFEQILDLFRSDIEKILEQNAICSIPWYYAKALEFQLGDDVVFNEATKRHGYAVTDLAKQIVKFVAVRQVQVEGVTKLRFYVSKASRVMLTVSELAAFKAYMSTIGGGGIHYEFISQGETELSFALNVTYNPLVIDNTGNRLSGSGKPVNEAIQGYLDGIIYGGVFNRTKLADAIQAAAGVVDVVLTEVRIGAGSGEVAAGQNIEAPGGCFSLNLTRSVINYAANVY